MATAPPLRAPYTTTPVRLAVASAAATVLLLSAVFATVHWVVVDAMTRQTFEALRERAGFALRVDAITNAPALRRAQIEALLGAGSSSDAAQLLSADGRPLWSSGPIAVFEADPSFALEARSARLIAFVAPGRLASGAAASRFAAIQLPTGDGRTLRLARPLLEVEEVSSQLFWGFLAALVAVTATAGLVAYVLGKRLELRLGELATTARDIAANDLTRRLQRTGDGDEIDRLTDTVNAMLERIAGLMAQLREVSDNMAHDLKTPLSRLRLRAETALSSGASPEQLSEALAATIDDADALLKTFETMLLVARLENGAERAPKEVVDAQALLADLVEFYEPIAEEAGAHLSVDMALRGAGAGAALPLVATSRHLLAQAVSNLLENALKYGRPVDPKRPFEVLVRLSADEEAVKLAVLDHGAGIPEAARARVFERFVRLDNSRTTPGTGLGLSLVAAVARLSQGSVQLSDNRPGLVATLILPRERSDAPREAQQARLRSVGAVEAPAAMVRA